MPRLSRHAATLTADQFEAALAKHPLTHAHAARAAREVLVDGESLMAASRRHGMTRQRLHEIVSGLHRDDVPPGWERRIVTLPPDLMKQVVRLERDARRKEKESQK